MKVKLEIKPDRGYNPLTQKHEVLRTIEEFLYSIA